MALTDGILVTGGAGFIGHHLVNQLAKQSRSVTVIDNLSNSDIRSMKVSPNVKFYNADVRDRKSIQTILTNEQVKTCIHLAAKISVADSMRNPMETVDVNVNGTLSVLSACAEMKVKRFIFASSAAVYGDTQAARISEALELNPLSPYGSSKASGELLMSLFKNAGSIENTVALRFFNVYGEGQSPEYAGVITKFKDRLSHGLAPIIYGSGNQIRDFVAVEDVVQAIILASEKELSATINIGTGTPITIKELARQLMSFYERTDEPIYENAINGDILSSCADISKAKRLLGYSPKRELFSTLRVLLAPSSNHTQVATT